MKPDVAEPGVLFTRARNWQSALASRLSILRLWAENFLSERATSRLRSAAVVVHPARSTRGR